MEKKYQLKSFCLVISDFYPMVDDFFLVRKGDKLLVSNRSNHTPGWKYCTNINGDSGWIPERYLVLNGKYASAAKDYAEKKLSVKIGDKLQVEKEISGWIWCVNKNGNRGWIPANNVERVTQ